MRNKTIIYNKLFESILDDVEQSDLNISSSISIDDSNNEIDYQHYEYTMKVYFARDISDYKTFVKDVLPKAHEQFSIAVEHFRMFKDVSPVRIATFDKNKLDDELLNSSFVKTWVDFVDSTVIGSLSYFAWTAVFCFNMPQIRNIRQFLNFIGVLFSISTRAYLNSGLPIIQINRNEEEFVTFFPNQISYTENVIKNTLKTDKSSNKKRSEYMGQYYLQFAKLSSLSGLQIAEALNSYFKIDWSSILFDKALKQYIESKAIGSYGQRIVKLDSTIKNFISATEVSEEMFRRMGSSLELYTYNFTSYNHASEYFITGKHWRPVNTIWQEVKKHPIQIKGWQMKTVSANLDYVLIMYLGLFDCSLYQKTDNEKNNPDEKSEPVHLLLVTGGTIDSTAIETKFREMFGDRFRRDISDGITTALFDNANS